MKTILSSILLLSSFNVFAVNDSINLNSFTLYTGKVYFNETDVTDRLMNIKCTNHNTKFKLLCKYQIAEKNSGVFSSEILNSKISEDFNTVTITITH